VLIIRRSKLHYTASGIITPIGGRLVQRLRVDWNPLSPCARDGEIKINVILIINGYVIYTIIE
jgi:hypothetical protein